MTMRRKTFVQGSRGVRVPFTEVLLEPTTTRAGTRGDLPRREDEQVGVHPQVRHPPSGARSAMKARSVATSAQWARRSVSFSG